MSLPAPYRAYVRRTLYPRVDALADAAAGDSRPICSASGRSCAARSDSRSRLSAALVMARRTDMSTVDWSYHRNG